MRFLLTFLLTVAPAVVFAQQLTIKSDCKPLSATQSADADYVPGVDVDGNPVAPANTELPIDALAYPLLIPVELTDLKTLDLDVATDLDMDVAFVNLFEDGRIEYNGHDISDRATFECVDEDSDDAPVLVLEDQPPPGGQSAPDAVPSDAAKLQKIVDDVTTTPQETEQKADE